MDPNSTFTAYTLHLKWGRGGGGFIIMMSMCLRVCLSSQRCDCSLSELTLNQLDHTFMDYVYMLCCSAWQQCHEQLHSVSWTGSNISLCSAKERLFGANCWQHYLAHAQYHVDMTPLLLTGVAVHVEPHVYLGDLLLTKVYLQSPFINREICSSCKTCQISS